MMITSEPVGDNRTVFMAGNPILLPTDQSKDCGDKPSRSIQNFARSCIQQRLLFGTRDSQFGSPRKGAYREVECINWILNLDSEVGQSISPIVGLLQRISNERIEILIETI